MRKTIDTASITPGKKAFEWEGFCLQKDNIRRKWLKEYDPMRLSPDVDACDWAEFQELWHKEHGFT